LTVELSTASHGFEGRLKDGAFAHVYTIIRSSLPPSPSSREPLATDCSGAQATGRCRPLGTSMRTVLRLPPLDGTVVDGSRKECSASHTLRVLLLFTYYIPLSTSPSSTTSTHGRRPCRCARASVRFRDGKITSGITLSRGVGKKSEWA